MTNFVKQEMDYLWGSTGDVVKPSVAKIQTGWEVEVVPRQWWNWMQNRLDTNVAYILQKGLPEWDNVTEYQANLSYVQRNNVIYKCIQTGINQDPQTASTYWTKAFPESSAALEALRLLTPAADRLPYFTSSSAASVTTLTSFARTILDDTSASAVRTTIGAQASDATLTAIAGAATGTNILHYFTGTDTVGTTTLSSFGRSLIDDADAAAARTTLGLGSSATVDLTNSQLDITTGRVLKVGDYGLGSGYIYTGDIDDKTLATGLYVVSNTATGTKPASSTGIVWHTRSTTGNSGGQIWLDAGSSGALYTRKHNSSVWSAWVEVQTTVNGASNAEAVTGTNTSKWMSPASTIAALQNYGLATTNIGQVSDCNAAASALPTGIYGTGTSTVNTPGGNGRLGVIMHFERTSGSTTTAGASQIWIQSQSGGSSMYTRSRDNVTGLWSNWVEQATVSNSVQKAGDTMSGVLSFSASSAAITSNTASGSDTKSLALAGGGAATSARGAYLLFHGIDHASSPGYLNLVAGIGGIIRLLTGTSTATERLRVTTSGNVLIGTTSDNGDMLQVAGAVRVTGALRPSSYLRFADPVSAAIIGHETSDGSDSGQIVLCGGGGTSGYSSRGSFVRVYGNENSTGAGSVDISAGDNAAGAVKFYTNTFSLRASIQNNGNFLIGTSSDNGQKLQVNGGTWVNGLFQVTGTSSLSAVTASSLTLSTALSVANGGTGATTASGARTNLGLGSGATATVQSSLSDTTANRLLITGGFGLGGVNLTITGANLNTATPVTGFYMGSGMANAPTSDWYFVVAQVHISGQYTTQTATGFTGTVNRVFTRTQNGGVWSAWVENATSANVILKGEALSAPSQNPQFNTSNTPTISSISGSGDYGVVIRNGGNGAASAALTFLRDGAYGVNLGLDLDNVIKIGGWSMGAVSYVVLHHGNLPTYLAIQPDGGIGTYAFLNNTTATVSHGGLVAGSSLRWSAAGSNSSESPPGTWKSMGHGDRTLWLRVA